ncbi:hypothetical protein P7K49_001258, partial [Saguinus oedipus]
RTPTSSAGAARHPPPAARRPPSGLTPGEAFQCPRLLSFEPAPAALPAGPRRIPGKET